MKSKRDFFSSRYAFLVAAIGMAIGAGNIWRFPRLAGQYGGSFLIPWLLFLFLWSIPLIIIEFSLGKKIRKGVVGVFEKGLGKSFAWMGWFIALCTTGIMFYYSVVCGWSLKYFLLSLTGHLKNIDHSLFWTAYTTSNLQPVLFHILALLIGIIIILSGVRHGIEKAIKIMLPLLFLLITITAVRTLTLPAADIGLAYLFRLRIEDLLNYKVWLEALSQSAWSTGAGWGLILTYANYVREKENALTNALMTGIGNNLASIICGLAIIPAVFSLSPSIPEALSALQAGNQGLTFIFLPQIFKQMPGNEIVTPLFFLALFVAAISSLIAMLELGVRVVMDYGYTRKKSALFIGIFAIIFGFPSAYSLKFFNNQDWVWGVGLLLSGFFFIFFMLKTGVTGFIHKYMSTEPFMLKIKNGQIHFLLIFMVIEFILMFSWWLIQSVQWYPKTWWNPFEQYSIASCIFQWIIVILIGIYFSQRFSALIPKTEISR